MNCPFCGSPLTLKDEKCPHCGTPNPDVLKHRADMEHYHSEFETVKKDVYTSTRRFTRFSVKTIIIAVLVILNVAAFFFIANTWNIYRTISRNTLAGKAASYCQEMDQMIADGSYIDLRSFYNTNSLYMSDEFDSYQAIVNASDNYYYIFQNLNSMLTTDFGMEYNINSFTSSIFNYFDSISREYFFSEGRYQESQLPAFDDIHERIELLLTTYCHFSEEDLESLSSLSENGIHKLLEERMGIHETEKSETEKN